MVKSKFLMVDEDIQGFEGIEIPRIYLRYLYIKGDGIPVGFKYYMEQNLQVVKRGKLYNKINKTKTEKECEVLLNNNARVKPYITEEGELKERGKRLVEQELEARVKDFNQDNVNIGEKLFYIWLILNYFLGELNTTTYKQFITIYAKELGLPELYTYYIKPSDQSRVAYSRILSNELRYFVKGRKENKGLDLLIEVKHSNSYKVNEKGEYYVKVMIDNLIKERKKCYIEFTKNIWVRK